MNTIYKKLLLTLFLLPISMLAQSTLTGTVTEKVSGQPLPGVNVIVKGTTNGASTDFDGKYSLKNLKSGDILEFSYLGFKTQEVTFTNQSSINVSLEEESSKLDEVVLIGYGNVKKKDATGSVSQLSEKEFNKGANVSAENLLQGRIAGVSINSGGGAPGGGSQIRIRGGSSLTASNDPLIVIDGLPVDNRNPNGSVSVLASLNPNDIESFNVLKDASATAIYGSRAANGVIIITTKKGGKKLSVEYNFQYGSGRNFNQLDVLSAREFTDVVRANFPGRVQELGIDDPNLPNNTIDDPSTPNIIEGRILSDTNWQDQIFRRTDFVDNALTIKGNLFNRIPARVSIGNTYQEGAVITNSFTRNSAAIALNPRFFNDHLKINVSANYANQRNRFVGDIPGRIGAALRFDPTKPVFDTNSPFPGGYFQYQGNTVTGLAANSPINPVGSILDTQDRGINNRIFGNVEVDYKFHFLPELRAVVNLGFDQTNSERTVFVSPGNPAGGELNNAFLGNNTFQDEYFRNQLLDAYLVYNKKIGKLAFDITGGYSYQSFLVKGFNTGNTFNPQNAGINDFGNNRVLIGYFGRANFTWDDKYILTLSGRRDGTSVFSEEYRWGNFPAAAFAWKMKEDFFKDSKSISDLKLRVGWGVTGQQDVPGALDWLALYSTGLPNSQISFGNQFIAVGLPQAFNPNIKWEETSSLNIGFDLGLLDNRITMSFDAFQKNSRDLFFGSVPFADGSNFTNSFSISAGELEVKGLEFNFNADIIQAQNTGDFNWALNFNATTFQREITSLPTTDIEVGGTGLGFGGTSQLIRPGVTPFSFFVYKQLYDTAGQPIEGAFADLDGNGIVNDADRYFYQNPDPDLLLGFSSTFTYKNFDLFFNLRASFGNRVLNQTKATRAYQGQINATDAQLANVVSSVFETGFVGVPDGRTVLSDFFVENASFLRMDNISLGYTFPKWLDGKASLRLFTGIQNAFIITEYSGLDPELGNNGIDNNIYPRQRQFLFGANIKF